MDYFIVLRYDWWFISCVAGCFDCSSFYLGSLLFDYCACYLCWILYYCFGFLLVCLLFGVLLFVAWFLFAWIWCKWFNCVWMLGFWVDKGDLDFSVLLFWIYCFMLLWVAWLLDIGLLNSVLCCFAVKVCWFAVYLLELVSDVWLPPCAVACWFSWWRSCNVFICYYFYWWLFVEILLVLNVWFVLCFAFKLIAAWCCFEVDFFCWCYWSICVCFYVYRVLEMTVC